jgi:hypothetical protein|tara:strand:- start:1137 stop:1760 length:624 start_codon:yes stop_codon:yes gene_type:complete
MNKMIKKKKLTKKQEAFVDLMVYQDYKQTKCAHLAGYENPGVSATRLLNYKEYSHVQERIRSLKAIQRTKNEITYEGIAKKLGEIRDIALADGSYGPAVTAEIARAKLAGLMVDRKELKIHKIDNMSRDQLEVRLQQLVQEHQIVIGEAQVVEEVVDVEEVDAEDVSLDHQDLEESLGQEIVEEALNTEESAKALDPDPLEDNLLEE